MERVVISAHVINSSSISFYWNLKILALSGRSYSVGLNTSRGGKQEKLSEKVTSGKERLLWWSLPPTEEGGEKSGVGWVSVICELVTEGYTFSKAGFRKCAHQALWDLEVCQEEVDCSRYVHWYQALKATWAEGAKHAPCCICRRLPRKWRFRCAKQIFYLVTCTPVTTFRNLQLVNADEKLIIKMLPQNGKEPQAVSTASIVQIYSHIGEDCVYAFAF